MATATKSDTHDRDEIMLGLLASVERDGACSQRKLAAELGIALGLVNAYLKRCTAKGLVKVRAVPTRRFAYYLTPKGFAEKSRLTVDYLASSFSFFRQARANCSATLHSATGRGIKSIALFGVSDLAEIAIICALEAGVTVRAVVDASDERKAFVGVPVYSSLDVVRHEIDAVLITDLKDPRGAAATALEAMGAERVLAPALLGLWGQDIGLSALSGLEGGE